MSIAIKLARCCPGLMAGLLLCTPSALADDASARIAWHEAIGAGYAALAQSAEELDAAASHYCDNPGENSRAVLEAAWRSAFLDWQAVRFIDFGPVEQNSRAWQLQFWPDPKNLVARKAGIWLKGDRQVSAEAIAQDSVAIQGFPALEYLLFDETLAGKPEALPAAPACRLMAAIAGHLEKVTGALQSDWAAFAPHYSAGENYDAATVTAALAGLEILQERRLGAPMGLRGNGQRNPYLADAWRSGQSLAALSASLQGLRDSFLPGLEQALKAKGQPELFGQVREQLDATLAEFTALPAMGPLLVDDAGYRRLQALYIEVSELNQLLNGPVASSLGVVRGFNSSDGD